MAENVIKNDGMLVDEAASVDAPTAGKGQFWVKNDTPNKAYFTDDAGTDFDLTAGAAGGETNTMSHAGSGAQIFDAKAGVDFPMRGIDSADDELLTAAVSGSDVLVTVLGAPTIQQDMLKDSPGTITVGQVVYAAGYGTEPQVELADADNASLMPAVGIAAESITNAAVGKVVSFGIVTADTTGESVGAAVYVDTTAGAWTTTRPTGTTAAIQKIGWVAEIGASGKIFVVGAGRSNDVPNLEDGKLWIGNASNVATAVDLSGGVTVTNAGVVTVAEIVGDTTPQLGGTLDCQDNQISLGAGTITIDSGGQLVTLTSAVDVTCEIINDGAGKGGLTADYFRINDQTAFYLRLQGTPTADRTVTFQDVTGTVALLGDKLSAFAATTSAELATVISDETGSGVLVYGTSPSLTTPAIAGSTLTGVHDAGGATSFEIPNGAGGTTVNAAGEVCVDTTSRTLNYYDGTAEVVLNPVKSKSVTIESPTTSDDVSLFYTEVAITVTKIVIAVVGTDTPSWTADPHHHTSRNNAGNAIITSPTASTEAGNSAESTGHVITSFDDGTIPALSHVWLETDAQSGTWTNGGVSFTIFYREDA